MSGGGVGEERSRLRRRCRSEGLEVSPYVALRHARVVRGEGTSHRTLNYPLGSTESSIMERPGLERFPLNRSPPRSPPRRSSPDRSCLVRSCFECPPPSNSAPERCRTGFNITSFPQLNGVESPILANNPIRNQYSRSSPTHSSPKTYNNIIHNKESQIRNHHNSPVYRFNLQEDKLPKVEELFEKIEYPSDFMDYAEHKQPLKSILNNPRKSPPPGILKKKSKGQEKNGEAKRRPRAMSESEYYVHCDHDRIGLESRLQNNLSQVKRMKDNSSSLETNNQTLGHLNKKLPATPNKERSVNGDIKTGEVNVLRTTAIRREESLSPVSRSTVPSEVESNTWLRKRATKCRAMNKTHILSNGENGVIAPTVMNVEFEPTPPADSSTLNKLSEKLSNGAILNHNEPVLSIPYELSNCVRASLFPRVPPYLKFISHDQTPPLKHPISVGKHLKWKLTTITPIVVKKTLLNSGFKLVRSDCDTSECPQEETVEWVGIWGKHMKSLMFRAIKDGQKMNHFPGTFQIGRKDRLWRNLQKLVAKHGLKEFGIMPKTYVLPHDMKLLKRDWEKYAARNDNWIIKPPASARGTGIAVVSRWSEIPKKRSLVVQRYICRPYLINGSKFDLRLYVLLTSMHPIKIYLYSDGLARFASVKYTDDQATLHDRYMHLTNYSINRMSKNYTSNEDANACQGHKWTLQTLMQYLKRERGVNTEQLWDRLKDLVIKTIISAESTIRSLTEANITSRYNCYELFGIDVLLDEDLKPWLLEVNISPSLHSASPLDLYVKAPLVTSVLNIAQFHLPNPPTESSTNGRNSAKYAHVKYDPRLYTVYLSKEERDKHIIYSKMEDRSEYLEDILSTLTADDVRHLVQAEDELAAGGVYVSPAPSSAPAPNMERIFPTPDTHKYLQYLATPKYYNRLLDAWENKYRHDRTPGINLLKSLCEMGYHLEVPPIPIKRELAARVSDTCRVRARLVCRWKCPHRPRAAATATSCRAPPSRRRPPARRHPASAPAARAPASSPPESSSPGS